MYALIRPLLFALDAECSHQVALTALDYLPKACFSKPASNPVQAFGYSFSHPVGLAAGLDKNGAHLDGLAKLGFSFIEVGTVTPKAQPGNPMPRLFRIPKARAIVNRMGFNNQGVDVLVEKIQKSRFQGILGINIGKNKDTGLNEAVNDYLYCLRKVYADASYVTINISSPNTPDLRQLQHGAFYTDLISHLREEQLVLTDQHQRYVPLVIKLSPDEDDEALKKMAEVIVSHGIDGIIATNTTADHQSVQGLPHGNEAGGVSGAPLLMRATQCLRLLKSAVGDQVTLIASGGIDTLDAAQEKLNAGASLLQVYTGLIYRGPAFVKDLADRLSTLDRAKYRSRLS